MSIAKEKKVRRLRKKRIWPSVMMLLGISVVFVFFVVLLWEVLVGETISGKLEVTYNNAEIISERIVHLYQENGWDKTFELLKESDDISPDHTPLCILEPSGKMVMQTENELPDVKEQGVWEMGEEYHLYLDKSSNNDTIHLLNGDVKISYKRLLENVFSKTADETSYAQWMQENIAVVPFWYKMKLSDSKYILAVKSELIFKRRDIVTTLELGFLVIIMMLLALLLLLVNIVSSIVSQRRMDQLMHLDTVTGGNNWLYFFERGSAILRKRSNRKKTFWIISIRMKKFRNYCICYGSKSGDELLEKVYYCLNAIVHKNELCARNAEAEFGLLLTGESKEELQAKLDLFNKYIFTLLKEQCLNYHVGVYEYAPEYKENGKKAVQRTNIDMKGLYHDACAARDTIRKNDGNEIAYFSQQMLEEQLWEHHVEERMENALRNKEFKVYLQPKYTPDNECLGGAEALVRWINEEDGFIPPNRFIPIFEKNGFVLQLDDYMLSEVARLQAEWISRGEKVVPVSVNVSRAHFTRRDLAEHICSIVDAYGTPHDVIELELTESAFFDDKEALLTTVRKLQDSGFAVSMDDFGSGYSSLNSLKDLPLDVIKLDAEFFRGEELQIRGEIIIKEIIQLAQLLRMRIVAEGIESKEQVDFLAELGCDLIQGFYFAKPMPVKEYEGIILQKEC